MFNSQWKMTAALFLTLAALRVHAAAVLEMNCFAAAQFPSSFLTGSCYAGNCSGNVFSESAYASGSCGSSVRFEARGMTSAQFVTGQCHGGAFSALVSGESIDWRGQCSDGTQFYGTSFHNGEYVTGTCQENGGFSASLFSSSDSINGRCK